MLFSTEVSHLPNELWYWNSAPALSLLACCQLPTSPYTLLFFSLVLIIIWSTIQAFHHTQKRINLHLIQQRILPKFNISKFSLLFFLSTSLFWIWGQLPTFSVLRRESREQAEFNSWLCDFLVAWTWVVYVTFLVLCPLKMVLLVCTSKDYCGNWVYLCIALTTVSGIQQALDIY